MPERKETNRHREAFEAWYAAGRSFRRISRDLAVPERTLYGWAEYFDWHERANVLDREAARIADDEAAKERALRQQRRRKAGELMAARGFEFLSKNEIDSTRDAIQAIKHGTEIERKEDGIPDWVMLILNADPNELEKLARDTANLVAGGAPEGGGADRVSPEPDAEDDD